MDRMTDDNQFLLPEAKSISPNFRTVLQKGLAIQISDRYHSVLEIKNRLLQLSNSNPIPTNNTFSGVSSVQDLRTETDYVSEKSQDNGLRLKKKTKKKTFWFSLAAGVAALVIFCFSAIRIIDYMNHANDNVEPVQSEVTVPPTATEIPAEPTEKVEATTNPTVAVPSTSVDFSSGDAPYLSISTDDDGAAKCITEIVYYEGSKCPKINVTDSNKVAKILFKMNEIPLSQGINKIYSISMDLIFESCDGQALGYVGGSVASVGHLFLSPGHDYQDPFWCQSDFDFPNLKETTYSFTVEHVMENGYFQNDDEYPYCSILSWSCTDGSKISREYNIYIKSICFYDKNGNLIT